MNREGYRDPTAEKAVKNVSRDEVTNGKLIRYCRSRPTDCSCGGCIYFEYCSTFHAETGSLPVMFIPEKQSKEFLEEVIVIRRRKRRE